MLMFREHPMLSIICMLINPKVINRAIKYEGGGGHINLPLSVHSDIDTWFVWLSPPTVLELQL